MIRLLKQYKRVFEIQLAATMAYKINFIIKIFALVFLDLVGPIVALLIYSTTAGIPGWSFEQFILFQGTLTLVLGIAHFFYIVLPGIVMRYVQKGEMDTIFVKPMSALSYLTIKAIEIDGIAEIFVGISLVTWAMIKLQISVWSVNFIFYLLMIFVAVVFLYALMVIMAALAIIFIKVHGMYTLYFNIMNFARYPLNIYGSGMAFVLTFIFPVAVAAFYPVSVLMGTVSIFSAIKIAVPVFVFMWLALLLWGYGVKRYSSAGG